MVRLLPRGHLQHTFRRYCQTPTTNSVPLPVRSIVATRITNMSFSSMSDESSSISSLACQGAGSLDDVITRSKNSSDIQTTVLGLPDIPRIPTKKRTFHLHHGDLETHVRPLLTCHWHVGRVGDGVDDLKVFSLNKLFTFKNFRSAVEFFDSLADIQDEENHHARATVDFANVYLSTHTHVAYQHTSDADMIRVPGLTSRDIRFAVKVEQLHDSFLLDARAITKVPVGSASLQAWSMEQLRQRYPAHVA